MIVVTIPHVGCEPGFSRERREEKPGSGGDKPGIPGRVFAAGEAGKKARAARRVSVREGMFASAERRRRP